MKVIKAFFQKRPIVYALFGMVLLLVLLKCVPLIPDCEAASGIREAILAAVILLLWGLIHGRRAVCPVFTGTKYGARLMRYIFILYCLFIVFAVGSFLTNKTQFSGGAVLNLVLAALAVGVVEEFTCRGMVFGGLVHAFGKTKKGVLRAAVLSGLFFGVIHVFNEILAVSDYTLPGVLQMLGKTLQAGALGFAFALIYIKTRNIWAVAALHSLNDALIFIYSADTPFSTQYVQTNPQMGFAVSGAYLVFTLFSLPLIIRTIRELKDEPEPLVCPLDDGFTPRAPVYVPRRKKRKQANRA